VDEHPDKTAGRALTWPAATSENSSDNVFWHLKSAVVACCLGCRDQHLPQMEINAEGIFGGSHHQTGLWFPMHGKSGFTS